jgi:hypothetical protein
MCLIKAVGINKYTHDIIYEIFPERFRDIVLKLTMRINTCNVLVIEGLFKLLRPSCHLEDVRVINN